jgi:sugar (pentulose or hexulose) kinase
MDGCVVVLDVGKTNVKVLAFDPQGNIVAERSRANGPLPANSLCPYLHLDTEDAWTFLLRALREIAATIPIYALSISTHGAAGVLVDDAGVVLPPMDYEWEGCDVDADEYAALRPPFDETLSPCVPRGLNLGRQLFHLYRHHPARFARARAFLTYPQYWAWRLCGVMASETSSLGCHTDLWKPREADFSSLVDRLGWRRLFPPLRRAWERLGPVRSEVAAATGLRRDAQTLCGAHDTNAALAAYLIDRVDPFTVISTGTWVIVMAVGGQGKLDPNADMLANVDVRGNPVPSARFMGGREFAILAGAEPANVSEADVASVVAAGVFALPSFSDQGGPFAGRAGRIEGPKPATPEGRTALATLYAALMTAHMLERLQAPGELIVEGGFAKTPAFANVLAALTPGRRVVVAESAAGAAEGAATLTHWGRAVAPPKTQPAAGWALAGLSEYHARWSALVGH